MERIRELLARLNSLTLEELTELRTLIIDESERVDGEPTTPENVAMLNELADAGEQVMNENAAREAAQAQAESDKAAARQRIAKISGKTEEGEEGAGEGEEIPAAGDPVTPDPALVTASGNTRSRVATMAGRSGKPQRSPERNPEVNRATLTATGALRGVNPDAPIEDRYILAKGIAETLGRLDRRGAARGDILLASARWHYPEDRQLTDNPTENARKLDAVTHPSALVATGGICAPVNVDYTVPTWASADRPLRDGLPAFEATRGGIRYIQPPDIAALAGATGIWTEATDANPAGATKPVISIACGTEEQVLVSAIATRLGFGNMQSAFSPEQVAANTDLAIAAAARLAENNILAQIAASCTQDVTTAALLGATRDLLTTIDQASAAYRWLHRIPRTTMLTAVLPDFVKDLVRLDLARELAHDNSGSWNVFMITDQQVEDMIMAHGVNPIWHVDGQAANGSVYPLQGWTTQAGTSAIQQFPAKIVWYMFVEGTIQFLDGGRLDLGVVRDSTLDSTNDYETFVETFENIAFRGFAGGAIQLVSQLCGNGGSAGTVNATAYCA